MGKKKYGWYPYVKSMLRAYPERDARYKDLKSTGSQGFGSGIRPVGKTSDPTADAALRELNRVEQKEYDAVRKALKVASQWKSGPAQLEIIRLMYFEQTHNLVGAAQVVHYSFDKAKLLHIQFLRLVAKEFGIYDGKI